MYIISDHALILQPFIDKLLLQTKGSSWQVPTGRRDGRISLASDTSNLPSFRDSVDVQKQKFAEKGLETKDLVALVGNSYLIHASL